LGNFYFWLEQRRSSGFLETYGTFEEQEYRNLLKISVADSTKKCETLAAAHNL